MFADPDQGKFLWQSVPSLKWELTVSRWAFSPDFAEQAVCTYVCLDLVCRQQLHCSTVPEQSYMSHNPHLSLWLCQTDMSASLSEFMIMTVLSETVLKGRFPLFLVNANQDFTSFWVSVIVTIIQWTKKSKVSWEFFSVLNKNKLLYLNISTFKAQVEKVWILIWYKNFWVFFL